MQYMLLLYASEAERQRASESEAAAVQRDRQALAADLVRTGQCRSSHALEPTASATTVRLRGGQRLLCDGPFAETREQLLGLLANWVFGRHSLLPSYLGHPTRKPAEGRRYSVLPERTRDAA